VSEFVRLFVALDETNKTNEKVAALEHYFRDAPPEDAAWALALLTGRRPRVPVKRTLLRQWAIGVAGMEDWLFDECYAAVGDLAETISLVLPDRTTESAGQGLAAWLAWMNQLAHELEPNQRTMMREAWSQLDRNEKFVLHKLLGGSFRVGVSQELVHRAFARVLGLDKAVLAHRLMGDWQPTPEFVLSLAEEQSGPLPSQPYPFCLAYALEDEVESLGDPAAWLVEWKWDGIRAQLIRREGQTYLWSRGEELIEATFPEVAAIGDALPDGTVLDGEILAWQGDRPMPFAELQRRLGRKMVGKKLLTEVPCALIAFDLLEWNGEDWRARPLAERRTQLQVAATGVSPSLFVSQALEGLDWSALAEMRERSREERAEGLMLKRLDSDYTGGRKRGAWWKWKIQPLTVDAVLIYAQRGSGKRASLYTDYTFGVWDGGALVPFAKAYSGLTDAEIRQVDRFIRNNIVEKFGPVRTVKPELVFELAFEGIQLSSRHKSGIAVRFPRILRWRQDKKVEDANTLEEVKALLHTPV
jgi:DNA ligase 1